jgi:AbrB family looped-hinge helix DNA binding protein
MSATSTQTIVQSNGQITIPDSVRQALGIKEGDRIEVVLAEDNTQEATLRRVPSVIESTYGLARQRRSPVLTEDFDRIVEEEVVSDVINEFERSR